MVSIQHAAENALSFARATLGAERTSDARIEEVESTTADGEEAWLITLGLKNSEGSLRDVLSGVSSRDYKIFTVLKSNGEVKAMRIRELANA